MGLGERVGGVGGRGGGGEGWEEDGGRALHPLPLSFSFFLPLLVPDFEEAVPGPCADRHAVFRHAQAAHAVVVAGQDS